MHSKNTTSSDQSVNDYSESRYAEFDEYMASLNMKRQKEAVIKLSIAKGRMATDRSKKLEQKRKKEALWYRVRWVMNIIALIIIAATLFRVSR